MQFRITYGAVYMTADNLAEARGHAMTEARELTRACGSGISKRCHQVRVYGFSHISLSLQYRPRRPTLGKKRLCHV